jgi:hypothetical protein
VAVLGRVDLKLGDLRLGDASALELLTELLLQEPVKVRARVPNVDNADPVWSRARDVPGLPLPKRIDRTTYLVVLLQGRSGDIDH